MRENITMKHRKTELICRLLAAPGACGKTFCAGVFTKYGGHVFQKMIASFLVKTN